LKFKGTSGLLAQGHMFVAGARRMAFLMGVLVWIARSSCEQRELLFNYCQWMMATIRLA